MDSYLIKFKLCVKILSHSCCYSNGSMKYGDEIRHRQNSSFKTDASQFALVNATSKDVFLHSIRSEHDCSEQVNTTD